MSTATYNNCDGSQPAIDFVRLLIRDTGEGSPVVYIFSDNEILAFISINAAVWQSSMFFSDVAGRTLPTTPSNYFRAAALALNALAGSSARLAVIQGLLDVKIDGAKAAAALRETAQRYLDMDDNSGAIAIAEQVTTVWSWRDRFIAQIQRQSGGATFP